MVPQLGGLYTWWFSKWPPLVPVHDTVVHEGRRLLYVGIAPQDSLSSGTLQSRLPNHYRGRLAQSTLRRTLSALLQAELHLSFTLTNAGKLKTSIKNETRLTQWMDENARVSWILHPEPWEVEDHLIAVRLPLNIDGSLDPFAKVLLDRRKRVLAEARS